MNVKRRFCLDSTGLALGLIGCWVWLTFTPAALAQSPEEPPAGWTTSSPRAELQPKFEYTATGGRHGNSGFVINAERDGVHGWWTKTFAVSGGRYMQFTALRKAEQIAVPRRSVLARILWRDENGREVLADPPPGDQRQNREGYPPMAYAEHPRDGETTADGWVSLSGVYCVPSRATHAIVELQLLGDAGARVVWSDIAWTEVPAPEPRRVRLASVHFRPSGGKTPMDNCRMFEPLIAKAAEQHADLVVLGETITYVGLGRPAYEIAEPVPGPSTDYFANLAQKYKTHIVVSLYERDAHLVYNVAVLLGPEGNLLGKYRKVCLPRDEVAAGVTPGKDYPVFETRFGKVGMMVCYDGFFPEVARELSSRGAEVIAWPVWGCNPLLAAARACENHVYLVSSTYTDFPAEWTKTAIYGHDGKPLVVAEDWGTVIVTEVDLNQRHFWRNNLGDFRAENFRHRPVMTNESADVKKPPGNRVRQ